MFDVFAQFLRRGAFESEAHAHAAGERHQFVGAQTFDEAAVTGEDDGEQDVTVEAGGGQEA